jgi:hypothetical protein
MAAVEADISQAGADTALAADGASAVVDTATAVVDAVTAAGALATTAGGIAANSPDEPAVADIMGADSPAAVVDTVTAAVDTAMAMAVAGDLGSPMPQGPIGAATRTIPTTMILTTTTPMLTLRDTTGLRTTRR